MSCTCSFDKTEIRSCQLRKGVWRILKDTDRITTPQRVRLDFRHTNIVELALSDEARQRLDHLLDRGIARDARAFEQVEPLRSAELGQGVVHAAF